MSTGYIHCETVTTSRAGSRFASLAVASLLVVAAMFISASSAKALVNPLLSDRQERSSDISPFTKWTSVLPRYEEQASENADKCIGKGCLNQKWEALLVELEGKPVQTQIDAVNKFFNSVRYVTDERNYGMADFWQTPYEMFERGGDCEDYAIAKYISLKRLGVSESDMRILIVRDHNLGGIIHALLEVEVDGEKKILDNQARNVKAVASIFHYSPVFAINEAQWWAYK